MKKQTKRKTAANGVRIALRDPSDAPEDAIARTLTEPSIQAATTIQAFEGDNQEVNALARELAAQIAAVNGDTRPASAVGPRSGTGPWKRWLGITSKRNEKHYLASETFCLAYVVHLCPHSIAP